MKHLIFVLLMGAHSIALAHHYAVFATYCVTPDRTGRELVEVYVFDPDTTQVLGNWDQRNYDDPRGGIDAWMQDKEGPGWQDHEVIFYEDIRGECERKIKL